MVRYLVDKIRPGKGFAHFFHLSIIAFIPLVLLILIRLDFTLFAVIVLLLSKWRMVAIHPRHWIAHIRTNAVDIIVGLSFLVFIAESSTAILQLVWVLLFEVWLLLIKPGTSLLSVSAQALIAQGLGLTSLFMSVEEAPLAAYVIAAWLICYFSARHFLAVFEEKHSGLISSIWAFFAACFVWVLGHWLLFFGPIAQPAVLLTTIGFGLSGLYYLDQHDRLSTGVRRQILGMMFVIITVIIVFSEWGDKTI